MSMVSNPTTTSMLSCEAIYAESGRDAVQQHLDKGANAPLNTIIDNTLGGSNVF